MGNEKIMNRWLVVAGAIVIQLCLGAIYAWSLFTKPLTDAAGIYAFSATQTAWVFSVGLASFAVVMVLAGRLMPKLGPRFLAIIGGIVLGIGYILAGFLGSSFVPQLIFIGFVGGAGIGLAYVVPIAVGVKWFPDRKGMITGLAVAGFGFGATIWVKAGGAWFGLVSTLSIAGLPPVQSTYLLYGVIFIVFVVLGGLVMVNPPEGWKPEGWEPPAPGSAAQVSGGVDFTAGQMLKTPQFFMVFMTFVFSALAGLMVIYCIKLFGIDALKFANGWTADMAPEEGKRIVDAASATAGTAMAFYAILNGLGRIAWGTVSDKIGRKTALVAMCAFQGIAMLAFYYVGGTATGLIVAACIIGFNFGGNFALFPAATADFFGNKNVGQNYGWVFLAYGVAGIAGPQVAGYFKDAAKGATDPSAWLTPFVIAGVACLAGAVIIALIKPPQKA